MSVSVILKNNSSAPVELDLIDFYGGNFKAFIEPGMAQNHTLMEGSDVVLAGKVVYKIGLNDANKEIVVAE
ncbi:MAG: hypothetical protein RBS56_01640 [Candidatus Gracilibacteria bacterium]|jgi:hypothetical protein|nr:hypothetical protein [Candidatus Gracilibacteria bacterium]